MNINQSIKGSENEILFLKYLEILYFEAFIKVKREFHFHSKRRWRFDFAWVNEKIAVEIDGIAYQAGGGRHIGDTDREKHNEALLLGWRVFRFSKKQLLNNPSKCIDYLKNAFIHL